MRDDGLISFIFLFLFTLVIGGLMTWLMFHEAFQDAAFEQVCASSHACGNLENVLDGEKNRCWCKDGKTFNITFSRISAE